MDDIILHGLEVPNYVLPRPSPSLLVSHFKVTSKTQINQTLKEFLAGTFFGKRNQKIMFLAACTKKKKQIKKENSQLMFTLMLLTCTLAIKEGSKVRTV